jgi:hypothetical protein
MKQMKASSKGPKLQTIKPIEVKSLESETGDFPESLQFTVRLIQENKLTIRKILADISRNLWHDSWARFLAIIVFVALLALLLQRAMFFPLQNPTYTSGPFTIFVQSPTWIAPQDEESFSITLLNSGTTDMTEVNVHLLFTDTVYLRTDTGGSTMIEFGMLTSGERKTRRGNFVLEGVPYGTPVNATVQLLSKERGMETLIPPLTMQVVYVSYFKTSGQAVLGSIIASLGIALGLLLERSYDILGLKK